MEKHSARDLTYRLSEAASREGGVGPSGTLKGNPRRKLQLHILRESKKRHVMLYGSTMTDNTQEALDVIRQTYSCT
ncbi:hypothetical protein E2C01_021175 [Portunus trituberculatus]|uniref:Uncharacterized protein n=1 Tax=Portunus trituberculatus TaxID=210409 RepID=A0A5B7E1T3_PORTR|nr:hypothetical protein [Portunus trituberculatus]